MAQSLAQIWLHLVFSTKNRFPFLSNQEHRSAMHGYLAGICGNLRCPSERIGGTADHVHILCSLSRTLAVADLLKELKASSSRWVKTEGGMLRKFEWQAGYAAFSVSPSRVKAVSRYIENQAHHHRRIGFKEELLKLLQDSGVDYDEAHLWD